jgi:hypothetical protein
MIKIGDRQVVLSRTFIVPPGEIVDIDEKVTVQLELPPPSVPVPDPPGPRSIPIDVRIQMEFIFRAKVDGESDGGIKFSTTPPSQKIRFEFIGWESPLGTTMLKPQGLGDFNGQKFGFLSSIHHIGGVSILQFQLLVGGTYA